jgi:hypothetical protein
MIGGNPYGAGLVAAKCCAKWELVVDECGDVNG